MPDATPRKGNRPSLLVPYAALTLLIIATLAASLAVGNALRGLYRASVRDANTRTERGALISSLHVSAGQVATPGNDIFMSGDVARETLRLDSALAVFRRELTRTRRVTLPLLTGRHQEAFGRNLDDLDRTVMTMDREARLVLGEYAAGRIRPAAQRMAAMDRSMTKARLLIVGLRSVADDAMRERLAGYQKEADRIRRMQNSILAAVVVLLVAIALYARQLVMGVRGFDEAQRAQVALLTAREQELERLSGALDARVKERTLELEAANEALRQSEERFQLAARATHDLVWDVDLVTGRTWYSEALSTLFGYPPDEPTGGGWWDAHIHPDDRDRAIAKFRESLAGTTAEHSDSFRFRRHDGSYAHVVDRGLIVRDDAGRAVRVIGSTMDVTERRIAADKLTHQHAYLRQVLDTIPHFVFAKDREGRFTLANNAVAAAYGVTVDQLLGKRDADFTPGTEEVENFQRDDLRVFDTGAELLIPEERIIDSEGNVRWLQTIKRPLFSDRYGIDAVLGVATDITALREASELNARLAAIVQATDFAIFSTDSEGRVTSWNPGAERIYGFDAVDVLGEHIASLIPPEAMEDANRMRDEVAAGGRIDHAETLARRRDGSLFDIAISLAGLYDRDGAFKGFSAIARDITLQKRTGSQLREREEQLAEAQRLARLGSWTWDVGTGVVWWSDQLYRLYELEPGVILPSYEAYMSLVHPDDVEAVRQTLAHALRSGEFLTYLFRVRTADGEHRTLQVSGSAVMGPDGHVLRLTGTVLDVTELKRAESAEREARLAAEAASNAKSEFLATMSHEIRTPMNGVLGMLELALATELSPAQRDFVQTARSSAESLLTVINDILDFSKIEAGHLELDARPFSLETLLKTTVPALAVRAEEKQLILAVAVDRTVPAVLIGDSGRLRQVIVNLVGNAIKFTNAGSITVRASAIHIGAKDVELQVSVRDTGIGIAPEHHRPVFDPFQQADSSTSRTFGGTGLGLSIAAQIVALMGGRIWLDSAPGQGSTFRFTARMGMGTQRLQDLAEQVATRKVGLEAARATAGSGLPRLRILMAEDNAVNQKLTSTILTQAGHDVFTVTDGQLAVDAVARQRFDLVLMDVQMPRLSGLEATRIIRDREGAEGRDPIPIIALTAGAMKGDRERCLAAGMDAYVSKPMTSEALFAAMAEVLGEPLPAVPDEAEASPSSAAGNVGRLLHAVGGDRALLKELIEMFIADYPAHIQRIRAAIEAGDSAAIQFAAHSVKGSSASLTGEGAASAAALLEHLGRTGDIAAAAPALDALERELARLRTWLLDLNSHSDP